MISNKLSKAILSATLVLLVSLNVSAMRIGDHEVPDGPNPQLTPGDLCEKSGSERYDEHIKYCERSVSSSMKKKIFAMYDEQLGLDLQKMPRGDFKIDHFIPLSIGGSNDIENLWPQHKAVYEHTDHIELQVFELMKNGKIKQEEAIRVVKECKLNLDRCDDLEDYLESLY